MIDAVDLVKIRGHLRNAKVNPTQVKESSNKSEKSALRKFAYYFKREFSFDFIPYSEDFDHEKKGKFFLFPDRTGRVYWVGGAGFYKDKQDWTLTWVWIHPLYRNKGILHRAWYEFEKCAPDFKVQDPVSINLQYFLLRRKFNENRIINGYKMSLQET